MLATASLCILLGGTASAAMTSADCAQCHESIAYNPITPHHNLASQRGLYCSTCHQVTSPTCTDCHGNPIIDPAFHENIHTTISISPDCQSCHGDTDIIGTTHLNNCNACHTSTTLAVVDTIAAGKLGTPVNCENCHGTLAEKHNPTHARTNVAADCVGCHGNPGIVPITHKDNCATCHNSTTQAVIDTITAGFNGTQVDCSNCHVSINHTAQPIRLLCLKRSALIVITPTSQRNTPLTTHRRVSPVITTHYLHQ